MDGLTDKTEIRSIDIISISRSCNTSKGVKLGSYIINLTQLTINVIFSGHISISIEQTESKVIFKISRDDIWVRVHSSLGSDNFLKDLTSIKQNNWDRHENTSEQKSENHHYGNKAPWQMH